MKASIGNSHGVVTVNDCFSVMKKFKIEIKHVGSYLIKVSNRNTGTPSEVCSVSSCYRTLQSTIWQKFYKFLIFYKLT